MVNDLFDALGRWIEAREEYNKRAEGVEYDRGYWLRHEMDALERAQAQVMDALNQWFDERLLHALEALKGDGRERQ